MDELAFTSAAELSALLRSGQISPTELVEATLRRIEDDDLNAFVEVDGERALAAARAVQPEERRMFAGVPIAVKANTAVAGLAEDHGSKLFAGHRAEEDAYLVRRLRDAGFVIVGITRMPEFGLLPTTEPRHGGPVRNPWSAGHTPGGSSGGAAAAVAGGLLPIAHGNDGGGSIRIPAACCGLLGLKPSRGRVSRGPAIGDDPLTVDGVLSRTVLDTALALDVLAGYEVGDATWAPRPTEPFHISMRREPGRLRIAMSAGNVLDAPVDPVAETAMREAGALLADLGHEVEEAPALEAGPEGLALFSMLFAAGAAGRVIDREAERGRPLEDSELEPLTRALVDLGRERSAGELVSARTKLQRLAREIVAFFADYDLLLTPALAERPARTGEIHGCGADPFADFARSGRFTPFTAVFNVSGQPAITIPWGVAADGLPVAVHLAAHPLAEDTLLQVALQVETARPWGQHRPGAATSPAPPPPAAA